MEIHHAVRLSHKQYKQTFHFITFKENINVWYLSQEARIRLILSAMQLLTPTDAAISLQTAFRGRRARRGERMRRKKMLSKEIHEKIQNLEVQVTTLVKSGIDKIDDVEEIKRQQHELKRKVFLIDTLPDGWESFIDEETGDYYYYNNSTGAVMWDFPGSIPRMKKKILVSLVHDCSAVNDNCAICSWAIGN